MYRFETNFLQNQQKFRRIPHKMMQRHWGSASYWNPHKYVFILTNFLTLDLRFFKFLLRKTKKKLLRLGVKAFINLVPNNKTSHKSKNCRMGKGKGLNNRFYCRLKRSKPAVILHDFSYERFIHFKKFLKKFFNYKYV